MRLQALLKACFKPAAFYRGLLLPLCTAGCTPTVSFSLFFFCGSVCPELELSLKSSAKNGPGQILEARGRRGRQVLYARRRFSPQCWPRPPFRCCAPEPIRSRAKSPRCLTRCAQAFLRRADEACADAVRPASRIIAIAILILADAVTRASRPFLSASCSTRSTRYLTRCWMR